jgi:putative inorganic carbon (hco3(-)) transporter
VTGARPLRHGALAALLAAGVAVAVLHAPAGLAEHGSALYPRALLAACAASVAFLVWMLPPWVTLTVAVCLSPLASNWKLLGVPGALSPDRLLLIGGVAAVLLRAPGVRGLPPLRFRPTHAVLALVLLYAAVSAAAVGTLFHAAGFFRLFDAFGILPFAAFLVAPVCFATARSRSALLAGLVVLGVYLGLTALFEATGLRSLVFPHFILERTADDTTGRAYGVFLEPVSNGAGLFDCGVAAAVAFATWRRAWARSLAAFSAAVCAAGTFFTLERSVWIGVAVSVVVAAVVGLPRRLSASRLATAGGLLAAAALIAGAALLLAPAIAHKAQQRANDQGTVFDRENLATAAENMIMARPLFGFGWSTFEHRSLDYFQQSPDYPLDPNLAYAASTNGTYSVHNEFLDYGVTLGLVGASLWLLGLVLAVGGAIRSRGPADLECWRFGLLPVFVFYLVIENAVPPSLFPNLALWLWLGVVWAGYRAGSGGRLAGGDDPELPHRARVE